MYFSKHNIFSKLKDSDSYFIVNPLSQNADILDENEAQRIINNDFSNPVLAEKKYVIEKEVENALYREKYLNFIDDRDSDEVQIFFVPWYSCNFACSYCYQDEYTNPDKVVSPEIIDAFFAYVDSSFTGRQKYITVFGGEPFLPGEKYKDIIERIATMAKLRNIDIAVVTNGFNVKQYIPILNNANVREVQVTLDGTKLMHDKRRMLKNTSGSFDVIVEGVDALLQNNIPVNLRMVVDKENIAELPELARFAIEKGWTKTALFKTQLGRNYELHHCQTNNQRLFTRIELYEEVYGLIQENPEILEFHKPGFSIAKFIFENGALPSPLFDSCPGAKTEWAFDYTGGIYSCTATVGKAGEELGTFYPEVVLKEDEIEAWEDRDVVSIPECKECGVQLACGGGCAAVAKNRTGTVQASDCRPIKELLELGIKTYFE